MIFLSSTGESVFQLIVTLLIFVAVLVLTYYSTKWIANYQKAHTVNRNLELIETIKVSTNKYISIVRTGSDKYLIVGVGKDGLVLLGELQENEVIPASENSSMDSGSSFQDVLKKFGDSFPKKKD
jgi:flagellar protein FliO/FliZ